MSVCLREVARQLFVAVVCSALLAGGTETTAATRATAATVSPGPCLAASFRPPMLYANSGPNLSAAFSVAAGDFNEDGHMDVALGGFTTQVFEGNGDGSFQAGLPVPSISGPTFPIDVADFDRDG